MVVSGILGDASVLRMVRSVSIGCALYFVGHHDGVHDVDVAVGLSAGLVAPWHARRTLVDRRCSPPQRARPARGRPRTRPADTAGRRSGCRAGRTAPRCQLCGRPAARTAWDRSSRTRRRSATRTPSAKIAKTSRISACRSQISSQDGFPNRRSPRRCREIAEAGEAVADRTTARWSSWRPWRPRPSGEATTTQSSAFRWRRSRRGTRRAAARPRASLGAAGAQLRWPRLVRDRGRSSSMSTDTPGGSGR
jgi:hypothetical protein